MKIAGIVAEYNPFHTGHAHQIAQTRAKIGVDCAVAAVMSGNWVQQADCAAAHKWARARLALMGGADLVLELPTVWAASGAESFARGAVATLNACGVVDVLSFGSECGEVESLRRVAACLDTPEYQSRVSRLAEGGDTFAVCRQRAVSELLGEGAGQLLASPNNNLGIEYIRALNALGSPMEVMTVLRRGAGHNTICPDMPQYLSATQIRAELARGNWEQVGPYLHPEARRVLEDSLIPDGLKQVERAILARLRTMTAGDWAKLPESGAAEGLPQRLERAGKGCTGLEEFFELAKTKRYTRARLNRLVLWAWLALTADCVPDKPLYIRVLGFNSRGREVLHQMRDAATLPILTKPAHARQLDREGRALFELEARCTDLYDLCAKTVPTPGREWNTDPVVLL